LKKNLIGLANLNIELTDRCNKECWMCPRQQKIDYPTLPEYGDMDYELVKNISKQVPSGVVVQFHDNGEPLLYPNLGEALQLFNAQIRCLDTNGKLLVEKADEIIDNLDTLTVSTFEGDPEAEEQAIILRGFLRKKGDRKPRVIIRCMGDVERYKGMACLIVPRPSPAVGNPGYSRGSTVPEIGICLDALHHMVIKRDGKVKMCVQYDPLNNGVIGDATRSSLVDIWGGKRRMRYLGYHVEGTRSLMAPCSSCDYWGVPSQ